MLKKHYKKLLAALFIIIALTAVRIYQAPVKPGAVLNAYDSNAVSAAGNLKLIFFDVGQGDSALIIAPDGEDILVDGGPDNSVVQKLGEHLPYTDRTIEYVILTHPHADHIDGLNEVLKRYEVGKIIMTGINYGTADYAEFQRLIKEKNIPVAIIDKPQDLEIGGADFKFLEPEKNIAGQQIANLNNSSIVFQLRYVSTTAMFTGDFEDEEKLVSSTIDLKSDVLKVGHHGSTNANERNFLRAVSPQFAVISVGAGNSYGLPGYRTIYYLKQLGAQVFRTDEDGDIKLESDGQKYRVVQ